MIVLGINTALANAQVSILKDGIITASLTDERPFSQATSIAGLIDEATKQSGINFAQIDIIGCAIGPGSFTGIRIGIAAAKGLEIALEKPLIGIDVFEAAAKSHKNASVSVLVDSRRNDFFCQDCKNGKKINSPYTIDKDKIETVQKTFINAEQEEKIADNVCFLALEKFKNNEIYPAVPLYIRDADVTICKK